MNLPPIEELLHTHLQAERDARVGEDALPGILHSRASSAGMCSRAIGFQVAASPMSDAPNADALFNFYLGDAAHDLAKAAILRAWPTAKPEALVTFDDYLVGHADTLIIDDDEGGEVIEIKSAGDFAWELAVEGVLRYPSCHFLGCETGAGFQVTMPDNSNANVCAKHRDAIMAGGNTVRGVQKIGRQRQTPEGPKAEHRLQAAIYAHGLERPRFRLCYLRKNGVKGERISAEWRFQTADYELLVQHELERHAKIVHLVREGYLPERSFGGEAPDPTADKWPCGYCSYQRLCVAIGPVARAVPRVADAVMAFYQ